MGGGGGGIPLKGILSIKNQYMLFTVFCENKYLPEETEKLNFSSRQFVTSRSTIPSFKYAEIQPQSCICSRDRYITHFYCLAVEAGFYSDVVECLPLDPVARFDSHLGRLGFFCAL